MISDNSETELNFLKKFEAKISIYHEAISGSIKAKSERSDSNLSSSQESQP